MENIRYICKHCGREYEDSSSQRACQKFCAGTVFVKNPKRQIPVERDITQYFTDK